MTIETTNNLAIVLRRILGLPFDITTIKGDRVLPHEATHECEAPHVSHSLDAERERPLLWNSLADWSALTRHRRPEALASDR